MLLYSHCLSEAALSRDLLSRASLGAHCCTRYSSGVEIAGAPPLRLMASQTF
jgi:hypothetical protein